MATIDPYVLKLFFSNDSFRCSFLLPGPGLPLVVVRACIRVGSPEKALHFVREKVKKQKKLESLTSRLHHPTSCVWKSLLLKASCLGWKYKQLGAVNEGKF